MNKVFEALERLAMPDEIRIEECKKLGISDLTEDYEIIKQALITKSKKEQGFDIIMGMLLGGFEFEEDREVMTYSTIKACEETFGKDSKEVTLIKELLNIDENKYINFCKEHSKNE